ncbi:MAG: D-arabinono-1,4-lactone oxidase [Solirubrobacteraceae bacterium]
MLERGRRFGPGDFPDRPEQAPRMFWHARRNPGGFFDLRIMRDVAGPTKRAAFEAFHGERRELIQDDDVFDAVAVGMGCMGIVCTALVEARPRFHLREVREMHLWAKVKADLLDGAVLDDNDANLVPAYSSEIGIPMDGRHIEAVERGYELLDAYEEALYDLGGRPHWGQVNTLTDSHGLVSSMYPRWQDWLRVHRRMNATGVFDSPFSKRVGIAEDRFTP